MSYTPHDASQTIIRRSKRVDKELSASIEIARKYDLVPRQDAMEFWVFIDDRSKPILVSETEEVNRIGYGRRGKWIRVREITN